MAMNRRKAIVLIGGIEAFLIGMMLVLYFSGAVKVLTFTVLLVIVGLLSSVAILLAIRKLPPM